MEMSKKKWKSIYKEQIKMGICYCYLCEKLILSIDDLSLDHKVPKSRNGTTWSGNLGPAHKKCNSDKGALTYDEYRLYRELLRKKNGHVK